MAKDDPKNLNGDTGQQTNESTLYDVLNRLISAIFFPDPNSGYASAPLLQRIKASLSVNIPLLRHALRNTGRRILRLTRRGGAFRALLVVSAGTIVAITLTGLLVFMLFFVAATFNAVVISLLMSLAAAGGFLALFFGFVAAIYFGALSVASFVVSTAAIISSVIAVLIATTGRKTEDEAQRIQTILYLSKPRKTAGPLLPLENPSPRPTDHPSLKRSLLISTEKKCEESSEAKQSEGEKLVIKRAVVVEKPRWIKHYSSSHRILLVGEGDFSFSCSLAVAFGCASNMVATSLDSKAFLDKNYSKAPRNIDELKKRGCDVMHGIDATKMATHQLLQHKTFDRIIFNFPFAGFFTGLSRDSSLRRHRRLVSLFLKNAKEMIDEYGEIHISHKTNGYHSEWNLVSIASSHGLRLIEEVAFDLSDYPGYNTKRGFGGDENFNCYPSNTYKFGLKFVGA